MSSLLEGVDMTGVELLPAGAGLDQATKMAVFGFLARYRRATLRAYRQDLKSFLGWCELQCLQPLLAQRPHLELYLRWMEDRGLSPATIGRRFTAVGGLYRYAVIDGYLSADSTVAIARPKVPWEGQHRSILHPLEFAALLTAARAEGPNSHTLVALLGMVGLRVGEACSVNVSDLHANSGYELLHVMGKGAKPATIPLPVPVLRAVREAAGDRQAGPLLLNTRGERMTRNSAAATLARLAKAAGLMQIPSPHALRRTFCTAGLLINVPLRDMQYAMRHADSRTTLRYDMARANLDRHAGHAVAAYLAGMACN
ncbi:MAG: phage integrase family protein [Frankiales bacterium]|nr:phage integrase family protein [Frankiales bacterium]